MSACPVKNYNLIMPNRSLWLEDTHSFSPAFPSKPSSHSECLHQLTVSQALISRPTEDSKAYCISGALPSPSDEWLS